MQSPEELKKYIESNNINVNDSGLIFFIDYYFYNSKLIGINAIQDNNLCHRSVIVTNHYPDNIVKTLLINNKICMLFKKDISAMPIHIIYKTPDLILLDDKEEVTKM